MTVESAEPPTQAAEIKPNIAPLFSSGKASNKDALKIAFPAAFKNAPINIITHIGKNRLDKYAKIKNTTEPEKPPAIPQKRALGFNFTTPSNIAQIKDATV